MKNENENEKLKKGLKKVFEEIVKVDFNDFVYESLLTMTERYEPTIEDLEHSLKVLNKNLDKLKTYDDLMRFLAGILKNTAARNQELIIRKWANDWIYKHSKKTKRALAV